MYNTLVLHKRCHAFLIMKYKLSYVQFIREVWDHYIIEPTIIEPQDPPYLEVPVLHEDVQKTGPLPVQLRRQ